MGGGADRPMSKVQPLDTVSHRYVSVETSSPAGATCD
jgi:hypothetical protein